MSTIIRIWIIIGILACVQGGITWVNQGFKPEVVEVIPGTLETLPKTIGSWVGKKTELDPLIFKKLGASDVVNRTYQNDAAKRIAVQVAAWDDINEWTPHHPTVCIPAQGWHITNTRNLKYENQNGRVGQVLQADRDTAHMTALYWYQLGPNIYCTREDARQARRQLWGQKSWPPILKVLMQSSEPDPDQASAQLEELAKQIQAWTVKLH